MRELNPRAWSIDGECWCTRVDYDGYKKEWSGIAPVLDPENQSKRIGEVEDANIIVEFPTGLKDKNGKEIYEGDIVKHGYKKKYIGQVALGFIYDSEGYYIEKHYGWGVYRDDSPLGGFADDSLGDFADENMLCEDVEVIGNIHENPELVKGANNEDKCR